MPLGTWIRPLLGLLALVRVGELVQVLRFLDLEVVIVDFAEVHDAEDVPQLSHLIQDLRVPTEPTERLFTNRSVHTTDAIPKTSMALGPAFGLCFQNGNDRESHAFRMATIDSPMLSEWQQSLFQIWWDGGDRWSMLSEW